jgi:hypothetical protein
MNTISVPSALLESILNHEIRALPILPSSRAVQAIYFHRTRDASLPCTEERRVTVTQRLKYEKFGNADTRTDE